MKLSENCFLRSRIKWAAGSFSQKPLYSLPCFHNHTCCPLLAIRNNTDFLHVINRFCFFYFIFRKTLFLVQALHMWYKRLQWNRFIPGINAALNSSPQETHVKTFRSALHEEEPMSCIGWIAVGYLQRHKSHINFDLSLEKKNRPKSHLKNIWVMLFKLMKNFHEKSESNKKMNNI